jgi:hypothetical protein
VREVEGKQVFTTLDELVDPRHTALVVVDMQRDFCTPGGAFDRLGVDISMYPSMVPRLVRLVDGARAAAVQVVYVLMTVLAGRPRRSASTCGCTSTVAERLSHWDTPPMGRRDSS